MTSFFKALTYENPYHPRAVKFNVVLPSFFKAVKNGFCGDVYPNEASHLKAFASWIKTAKFAPKAPQKKQLRLVSPDETNPAKKSEQNVSQVYATCSNSELQESHENMIRLIESSSKLAQLPQFFEHRRALVNELIKRGLSYDPVLIA